ncbi:MAG: ferrous iron transport protein B [Firmicutes bacterium]|nr:ferrous iron transport protein B [Bacillota bacterium]
MPKLTVALAGNPNSGKTTLFNVLTGTRQYVGNWPGVTVEKKEGKIRYKGFDIKVVDLPGTYSLNTYSMEEVIAKNFISGEDPDVVINIVDGTNLERHLYLTVQLLELGVPVVLALNMIDEVEKKGFRIDYEKLSGMLGIDVVPITAAKGVGITDLLERVTAKNSVGGKPAEKSRDGGMPGAEQTAFFEYYRTIQQEARDLHTEEASEDLIQARYDFIDGLLSQCLIKSKKEGRTLSDRIDTVVTNKVLGIPIFLGFLYLMFRFTFAWVGQPLADLLDVFFGDVVTPLTEELLQALGAAEWLKSLVIDGVIGGVGGVVTFVPLIFALFLFIAVLEDSGYMARVAFITDRAMRSIGLSGKAFIPMIIGFGCTVPAIMATRTLEDDRDRKLTMLIVPFMSCGARLPVYALFAAVFFPGNETNVVFSLYILGIVIAVIMGLIFKNTLFRSETVPFVMELPPYRIPVPRSLVLRVWDRGKEYLQKAGTIIFAMAVVVWFLSSFNLGGPADMADSLLAGIGKGLAPLFAANGFGSWEASVALLTGLAAKEVVVATLGVVYGLGELAGEASAQVGSVLPQHFSALSAYAFMVFVLLYTPCLAVVAVMKKEFASWKWTAFAVFYQLSVAWAVSALIFQGGRLLGL